MPAPSATIRPIGDSPSPARAIQRRIRTDHQSAASERHCPRNSIGYLYRRGYGLAAHLLSVALQPHGRRAGQRDYGATSPILLLENLRLEDAGYYGCYAVGPGGVTGSAVATLTVLPPQKSWSSPRLWTSGSGPIPQLPPAPTRRSRSLSRAPTRHHLSVAL